MDEQEDIKIKSSKCWNPIRPPTTLLTSNGRQICIRPPFSAREYLMESSWSPLSNGSSLIAKFHLIEPQLKQQGAASPIMGLWVCNFVWDPGPSGAHVGCAPTRTSALVAGLTRTTSSRRPLETCRILPFLTHHHPGSATRPRIRKTIGDDCAPYRHLRRDMRSDQHDADEVHDNDLARVESILPVFDGKYDSAAYVDWELAVDKQFDEYDFSNTEMIKAASHLFMLACSVESNILKNLREKQAMLVPPITDILQGAQNIHGEKSNRIEVPSPSLTKEEEKTDAATSSEQRTTGNLNGAAINQGECAVNELKMSAFHAREEQPLVETIAEMPLSQVDLLAVPCDKEELCDNASLISMPQLKHVVVNGLRKEHHMEKPRTVFREEGEDDVTMATMDATIAHIMDEQEDIKIKSSKCWNPIQPPTTLLTSNGRRICIRPPFSAREYLMESSWSPLSNGSILIVKFHLIEPQLKQQVAASPIMGLWACNFVWDPGPSGAHVGCAPTSGFASHTTSGDDGALQGGRGQRRRRPPVRAGEVSAATAPSGGNRRRREQRRAWRVAGARARAGRLASPRRRRLIPRCSPPLPPPPSLQLVMFLAWGTGGNRPALLGGNRYCVSAPLRLRPALICARSITIHQSPYAARSGLSARKARKAKQGNKEAAKKLRDGG
uniref:Retrotransposon, putative, centromere-specific n=1 Tax=Oryza sativa subsp. japonica TaxID=39947 RepID=Q6I5K8_ORYSJ|nr:unknown protein [Oryza sativa Japonica Group]